MSISNNRKAYAHGIAAAERTPAEDMQDSHLKAHAAYYGYRAIVEAGTIVPSCDASVAFVQGFNGKGFTS